MADSKIKMRYRTICEKLGLDAPKVWDILKERDKEDDYQRNLFDEFRGCEEDIDFFESACLCYLLDRDKFNKTYL